MTAESNSPKTAAETLIQAHRIGRLLSAEPFGLTSEAEAYEVQTLVADELGHRSGWKVGLNSDNRLIHAPLYAEQVHRSPATHSRKAFNRFLLECELAIIFRKGLPPRSERYTREEVQAAAGFIHAAFEIVDTRFESWPDVEPLWLLADGLSHGSFILGEGVELNDPATLEQASYQLKVDGDIVQAVERMHPQPDPWDTLTQLANFLSATDTGLGEGDVVTTGSFSGVTPLERGQVAEVRFSGVGACRLTLQD